MEFTKLLKYGCSVLTLILIGNGLYRGFDLNTTVLSVVLVLVAYLLEARLIKQERDESEARFKTMVAAFEELVNKVSRTQSADKAELVEKISLIATQIQALKTSQSLGRIK